MGVIEHTRGRFTISTDRSRLDTAVIHEYLSTRAYWALGRPREVVRRSIEGSLCFGVYGGERQVGFARVVTDFATFAWLCDVFILESASGAGLGKWLVECIVRHPDLQGLRLFLLATRDAHDLYRRYAAFEALDAPQRFMARWGSVGDTPPEAAPRAPTA